MRRKLLIGLTILSMMAVGFAVAAKDPPTKLTIPKCGKKRKPVSFQHKKHVNKYKVACEHCHHLAKDPKRKKDAFKPCAACHAGKSGGKKKWGCADKSLKTNPYHVQCRGCHAAKKKGPRGCSKCHK